VGGVAIVTGGANGIGAATVRLLCGRGLRVAILDVDARAGVALAAELAPGAAFFECDVSSEESVEAAFAGAAASLGPRVDVLVTMAALFVYGRVENVQPADWDRVLAVNVKGTALCMAAALRRMRPARKGAIVLVSSITGHTAFPAFVPYSATKAALVQMARDTALDNGIYGVRVNVVSYGPILTDGGTVAHAAREGRPLADLCDELSRAVALRRMGTVDEAARVVAFLASDEAAFVTGADVPCDGGFCRIVASEPRPPPLP
jgi:NAD(P)-dependent dehydrogenase (short-subunit alcohol dehydrogenase family)